MVNKHNPAPPGSHGLEDSAPVAETNKKRLLKKYKVTDVLAAKQPPQPDTRGGDAQDAISILLKLITDQSPTVLPSDG